ncbi:MAG: cadmium-translocating P-type ATPase [Clostridiales Family XIII bacterium]|jgi:Cd2+/Zn2+-exporting ATPase|nr:cadmium-translocating P-type ATPase [Clostridiales Family XIII bacterium]
MSIIQNNKHDKSCDCCEPVVTSQTPAKPARDEAAGCACCQTGPTYFDARTDCCGDEDKITVSPPMIGGAALFVVGLVFEYLGGRFLPESVYSVRGDMTTLTGAIFFCAFLAAYLLIGHSVLLAAARGIIRKDVFNENTLMSIASIGAFIIGEYPEAAAVMLFYSVGEYLQDRAVDRSKLRIRRLLDIRPDTANVIGADGAVTPVRAEEIAVGAKILVRPGERVPLDGIIEDGESYLDMSALTGESVPVIKEAGDEILAGSMNESGLLVVRVTKLFGESTASRIIGLVESAEAGKAKTENFITRFARVYTPVMVGLALLIAVLPPLLGFGSFMEWVHKGLVFLVVSCPCALVISIPVGFFGGIGAASARGILVKGGNFLETLANADTVVFDKTGTLTTGAFHVTSVRAAGGFDENEVLRLAAAAEKNSTHPIARSIVERYEAARKSDGAAEPAFGGASDVTEKAGHGIITSIGEKRVLVGNKKLLAGEGVSVPDADVESAENLREEGGTVVYVTADGVYAGVIALSDTLKPDSKDAVDGLRALGISHTELLTGDRAETAEAVRNELGISEARSGLMPWQKVEVIDELIAGKKGAVIFMGDGINDAPVLARADAGIAMGALGSDAAIEAADIVIMDDAPSKLLTAIAIARKTKAIVRENIVFSLGIKAAVLVFAALGFANLWVAVFADVGVALLAVANALRAGSAAK